MIKNTFLIFCISIITTFIYSCSDDIVIGEVVTRYNKKTDTYTIEYPEYNKIYPKDISVQFRNQKNVEDGLVLNYHITTDNQALMLKVSLKQDEKNHTYYVEHPLVEREVSVVLDVNSFSPPLIPNKKVSAVSIKLESIGDIDTKDEVSFSITEMKKYLKARSKRKRKSDDTPKVAIPESGHITFANPPTIVLDKQTTSSKIFVYKSDEDFVREMSISYNLRNGSLLSITNVLSDGKWYIRVEDANNTNKYSLTHFYVDSKRNKNAFTITAKSFTNQRPYTFANKQTLDMVSYLYNSRNYYNKNILALKDYAKLRVGKWSKDKILYQGEMRSSDSILFSYIPSHTMLFSLASLFEATNTNYRMEVKNIVRDLCEMDITKVPNNIEIEAVNTLSISVITAFDYLYSYFEPEELIRIKGALIKYGESLYKYLLSNYSLYRKENTLKYASTLALISINMINENLEEAKVSEWYRFSLNYINILLNYRLGADGSLKVPMSESFSSLMPIMLLATTLKNIDTYDFFALSSIQNIGRYLVVAGYPDGYALPFGDSDIDYRLKANYKDKYRHPIMELLSRVYSSPIYKNYANINYDALADSEVLPFMIIWGAYNVSEGSLIKDKRAYQYGYFPNIETVIYNENIFTRNSQYFSVYAKGYNIDKSFKQRHLDRLSFLYYNYGDDIISEAGFNIEADVNIYSNLMSDNSHSIINVNEKPMLEHLGTHSYIVSHTNTTDLIYVNALANKQYSFTEQLKDYSRRFYYMKPDMIVIKDNIEALQDVTKNFQGAGHIYTWKLTSRFPITYDNANNVFIIESGNAHTYVSVIENTALNYYISTLDIGEDNPLYICSVKTIDRVKKFSPWVIIETIPKRDTFRSRLGRAESIVNFFDDTLINFKYGRKNITISSYNQNTEGAVYTSSLNDVIIVSD